MAKVVMQDIINEVNPKSDLPVFNSGDTIAVHYKIKEGSKERVQVFQGVVLQRRGDGSTETFSKKNGKWCWRRENLPLQQSIDR